MSSSVTANSRAALYPNELYADNGILFYKSCCHGIDLKLPIIKNHLASAKHNELERKAKNKPNERQVPIQLTLQMEFIIESSCLPYFSNYSKNGQDIITALLFSKLLKLRSSGSPKKNSFLFWQEWHEGLFGFNPPVMTWSDGFHC